MMKHFVKTLLTASIIATASAALPPSIAHAKIESFDDIDFAVPLSALAEIARDKTVRNPKQEIYYYHKKGDRFNDFFDKYRDYAPGFYGDVYYLQKSGWEIEPKLHDKSNNMKNYSDFTRGVAELMMFKMWNKVMPRAEEGNNPNARSAFCYMGKEALVLANLAIVCDKDFQLDPDKQFKYWKETDLEAKGYGKTYQAPKITLDPTKFEETNIHTFKERSKRHPVKKQNLEFKQVVSIANVFLKYRCCRQSNRHRIKLILFSTLL